MSKKKNQPEYRQYYFCSKCGKVLCKAIELPYLDANYCSNCGTKLNDDKKKLMQELNKRRVF